MNVDKINTFMKLNTVFDVTLHLFLQEYVRSRTYNNIL